MGTYRNGGNNEIGIAVTGAWAAVWTVDTPYIDVLDRDFYDDHKGDILEAAIQGETFSTTDGQTGAVAVISTGGDLDEDGYPREHDGDASEYVAAELSDWTRTDGGAYERAIADGYTR